MKKFQKFFRKIKILLKGKNISWVSYLPKALTKFERYLIASLILIVTFSAIVLWYHHYLKTTHEVANYGSTLTLGMVGEPKDFEKNAARLTNAGLTRLTETGEIAPDLAESWQVLDDGKTYQFKIRKGYSAGDLLSQLQNNNLFSSIDVSAPDDQTLVFSFKQPFSPFLYTSTTPIFSYGPYKISSETQNKITLDAVSNYWQGKSYISEIQVNLYSDNNSLLDAAKNGSVMGYLKDQNTDYQISDSTTFDMSIPRYLNLFFNLSKPALQDINIRTSLRDNKALAQPLTLTLVTSNTSKNQQIAQNIQKNWKSLNVTINIQTYDNVTLQKDIIPNRNYDLLLYGQDYGPDPDPYPFWHSSQISTTGENLSDFSNKNADKLLEDARLTFDFNTRVQKYKDFQTILSSQVPYINIEQTNLNFVLSNDVHGVNKLYGSSESDVYLNVNKWYIKTKRVKN